VVHLIRHSLKYVPRREREQVARDLKSIYTAVDADAAQAALEAFDDKWGARFPGDHAGVAKRVGVRDAVPRVPPELRRVVYTTNAIEALNPAAAQSDQDEGSFPQRGGRLRTDLPRHYQRRGRRGRERGTGRQPCSR
jgi:putative transposase